LGKNRRDSVGEEHLGNVGRVRVQILCEQWF